MPWIPAQTRNRDVNGEVFEAVWRSTRDQFYDPGMRGVDWISIRNEFLPHAEACTSAEQLITLLRDMLSRLRNSHIFLYSPEEWAWRRHILPFCSDRVGIRVFVRYTHRGKDSAVLAECEFGDEVISVDGVPAENLRPTTLARLEPVKGNPTFGPAGSVAEVLLRRSGRDFKLHVARVVRPTGFEIVVVERPSPKTVHIRFFTLGSRELPRVRLQQVWADVTRARGLILDLRNCVGGDSEVTSFIAGSLLGSGKRLFRSIPRPDGKTTEIVEETDHEAPRFTGRVAVITNSNTESQPEMLAAICREYGCARVLGERTAGAFNGWTRAIELPYRFANFALPYTRTISPKGIDYEDRGVEPDEAIANSLDDFERRRDSALEVALRYVEA